MTNIGRFSIETKVCLNDFLGDIFKNLNIDNQMSLSSGQDEPLSCPKNSHFSCVRGVYFVAFFIDHPVIILVLLHCFYSDFEIITVVLHTKNPGKNFKKVHSFIVLFLCVKHAN